MLPLSYAGQYQYLNISPSEIWTVLLLPPALIMKRTMKQFSTLVPGVPGVPALPRSPRGP